MPGLSIDPNVSSLIAVVGAGVGLLGLLVGFVALARLRGLRRAYTVLQGQEKGTESFVETVSRKVEEVERLRAEVERARNDINRTRHELADAIRHVSVVRYDAFGDMGGRLSFSAAMLDDAGDGLVITSINGRSETRSYAKGVKDGHSDQNLSPEEEQAIAYARGSARPPQPERAKTAGHG